MDGTDAHKMGVSLSEDEHRAIHEDTIYLLETFRPSISQAAHSAPDPVSTDTSPVATGKVVSKEPASLFSLPRELRHEIYGYLLDGKCTALGRDRCFHTNILRTNSTIRDEAENIMAEKNVFVSVSLTFEGISKVTTIFPWIRIVSERNVARFRRHHMSLRLRGTHMRNLSRYVSRSKFVVLLDDLPLLCSALRMAFHCCNGNSTYVERLDSGQTISESFHDREDWASQSRVSIHLFDTKWRPMSQPLHAALLRPLMDISTRRMDVTISGRILDQKSAENVTNTLSPALIWTYAHYWQLLESFYDAKSVADRMIQDQQYPAALNALISFETMAYEISSYLRVSLPSDLEEVAIATWILTAETQAMACYLLLRQTEPHHTVAFAMLRRLDRVASLLDPMRVHSGVRATVHHMVMLTNLLMPQPNRAPQSLDEWEGCSCAADPYIKHDIEFFRRQTLGVPNAAAYLGPGSSRFAMPPRVLSSHLNLTDVPPVPKKPSYVVGKIDTQHLARLTREEKQKIRQWQIKNNTIPRSTDTLLD